MATLLEDIKTASSWIVKAFAADNLKLDYSIDSFIEIDRFFNMHVTDGVPNKRGRLAKNAGQILFALGAYVGETIIRNVPGSKWVTDDADPQGELTIQVDLPNGSIWPVERMIRRLQNGVEDAIYPYGHLLTEAFTKQPANPTFWEKMKTPEKKNKWWKFW